MAKENDAPTEIETITLTMSRPVAEAVQTACEWYLRLHMGQFWDLAEDLCFAKFYSDAENNAFQSEEQRKNAFNVAIGRRNTIELTVEVENPDNRSVEEDIIGALSESLHHFDVVNYTEDPPVRPYWGKYCGILKEDYYGCPICGYITNWQPETCPVCHTRLEMWDGKGKGA